MRGSHQALPCDMSVVSLLLGHTSRHGFGAGDYFTLAFSTGSDHADYSVFARPSI
jgi:hypothetical protein